MNNEQQRIWNYLQNNAIGYGNRVSSDELRENLNLESGGPTNEHVRELIRDMVFTHGCIIGSLMYRRGYWIIENEDELNMVIDHLNRRAESVINRANILRENWNNRDG